LDIINRFLRLQNGNEKLLYIVDAYHGIYKLNVQARAVQHVVTFSTKLTYERGIDPKALLTSSFFNDLDVSVEGKIAFTDSSYRCGTRKIV
jgi:sugar lactone lactonase YvrE